MSIRYQYFIIIFCFIIGQAGIQAQAVPDSTIQQLDQLTSDSAKIDFLINDSWNKSRIDPEQSLTLLGMLNTIMMDSGTKYKQDVLFYYYGIFYKNLNQYDSSEFYLKKYYDFHFENEDIRNLAVVTMAMANLYSAQGAWSKSMVSVTESLKLNESLKDTLGIVRASSKLGDILGRLKRYRDGLAYHHKSRYLAGLIGDELEEIIAIANAGISYENIEMLDSARYNYLLVDSLDEVRGDKWGLVYDKANLGRLYMKLGLFEEALVYAEVGHRYALELKAPSLISFSQRLYGDLLIKTGKVQQGVTLIEEIINNDLYNNSLEDLRKSHEALYEGYKESNNLVKALEHLEEYRSVNDSILDIDIANQINNLEIGYQTEKKVQEISMLNAEKEISSLNLAASKKRTIGLALILGVFSFFMFFLWRLYRQIQAKNEIISKALKEKETLLKEIHHRVKNNLQVISSLLNIQSRHVEDQQAIDAIKEGRDRVKSMALIHQNLYQENNLVGVDLPDYIHKLSKNLIESYQTEDKNIELITDIDPISLDVDTVIPIGLIINELLSNALKYAFVNKKEGKIAIKLKKINDAIMLEVADDGVGLKKEFNIEELDSMGYNLIKAFSHKMDADLNVENRNGTAVSLRIRKYKEAG